MEGKKKIKSRIKLIKNVPNQYMYIGSLDEIIYSSVCQENINSQKQISKETALLILPIDVSPDVILFGTVIAFS